MLFIHLASQKQTQANTASHWLTENKLALYPLAPVDQLSCRDIWLLAWNTVYVSLSYADSPQRRSVFGVIFPMGNPDLVGYEVNTLRPGAKRNAAKKLSDWQRLWKEHSVKPTRLICWNNNERLILRGGVIMNVSVRREGMGGETEGL